MELSKIIEEHGDSDEAKILIWEKVQSNIMVNNLDRCLEVMDMVMSEVRKKRSFAESYMQRTKKL